MGGRPAWMAAAVVAVVAAAAASAPVPAAAASAAAASGGGGGQTGVNLAPGRVAGLLLLWALLVAVGVSSGAGAEADVAMAVSSTVVLGGAGAGAAAAAERRRWGRRGAGAGGAGGRGGGARTLGVLAGVVALCVLMATAPRERWVGDDTVGGGWGGGGIGGGEGGSGAWEAASPGVVQGARWGTAIADGAAAAAAGALDGGARARRPLVVGASGVNLLRPTDVERLTRVHLFDTSSTDEASAIALGPDGSVYLAGKTTPASATGGTIERALPGASAASSTGYGGDDVFVAKVSPVGRLMWVKVYGSEADDAATGVAVSASGLFVVGHTRGQLSPSSRRAGAVDFFLSRLSPETGDVRWTVQGGSIGRDALSAVALGPSGDVFAVGHVGGAYVRPPVGASDVLILRYRPDGVRLWAAQHAVGRSSTAAAIAVSSVDGSLAVGVTAYRPVQGDQETSDAAALRVSPTGRVVWTAHAPTFSQTFVNAITVDAAGAVYVGASEWKHVYENYNMQLRKLSPEGTEVWVTSLTSAGAHADYTAAVGLSPDGKTVQVAGYSAGNFLLTIQEEAAAAAAANAASSAAPSHFIAVAAALNADTGAEAVRFQDTSSDAASWQQLRAMAVDPTGVLLLTGYERATGAAPADGGPPPSTINVLLASFIFRPSVVGGAAAAVAAGPTAMSVGASAPDGGGGGGSAGGGGNQAPTTTVDGGVVGGSAADKGPSAAGDGGSLALSDGDAADGDGIGGLPLPLLAGGAAAGVALVAALAVAVALTVRASTARAADRQAGPTSAAASGGAGRRVAPPPPPPPPGGGAGRRVAPPLPPPPPGGGGGGGGGGGRGDAPGPTQPPGGMPTRTVFWGVP